MRFPHWFPVFISRYESLSLKVFKQRYKKVVPGHFYLFFVGAAVAYSKSEYYRSYDVTFPCETVSIDISPKKPNYMLVIE